MASLQRCGLTAVRAGSSASEGRRKQHSGVVPSSCCVHFLFMEITNLRTFKLFLQILWCFCFRGAFHAGCKAGCLTVAMVTAISCVRWSLHPPLEGSPSAERAAGTAVTLLWCVVVRYGAAQCSGWATRHVHTCHIKVDDVTCSNFREPGAQVHGPAFLHA